MTMEHSVKVIVMLTKLKEKNNKDGAIGKDMLKWFDVTNDLNTF